MPRLHETVYPRFKTALTKRELQEIGSVTNRLFSSGRSLRYPAD